MKILPVNNWVLLGVNEWLNRLHNDIIWVRDGVDIMVFDKREHDIYFAGGCFWGVERYFSLIEGVLKTETGYANGNGENPTYERVCSDTTNFVECVHVVFDPDKITVAFLLCMFFKIIDPTLRNRQGNDIGSQYRTGIYYTKKIDAFIIEEALLNLQKEYLKPLAVECTPIHNFYRAEEYHQKYLEQHPNGYCHISTTKFDEAKSMKCCKKFIEEVRFQKKSEEDLRFILSEEQFEVTQRNATEPPFNNAYWNTFEEGIYIDVTTGEPLFVSCDKFESGCGWPSFSKPIKPKSTKEKRDQSFGMERTEVRSNIGDAHLGHIFHDGPKELGGLRYCINSAALTFIPKENMMEYGYKDYLYLFDK